MMNGTKIRTAGGALLAVAALCAQGALAGELKTTPHTR